MQYEISKDGITAKIDSKGAELVSLTKEGREYIWEGDSAYWGRHAPVLFPFVGSLKCGSYTYENEVFPMGQHGFARDMEFSLKKISKDMAKISFVLTDNEETYAKYPFHFRLEIKYSIVKKSLVTEWLVTNTDEKMLYSSLGGHPAFNCPFSPVKAKSKKDNKYCIKLSKNGEPLKTIKARYLENGLASDRIEEIKLKSKGILIPDRDLFKDDALILENNQIDRATFFEDGEKYLSISFKAPVAGIWSPAGKDAPFICIEPWFGRADATSFDGELKTKEYGNALPIGATFKAGYRVQV